MAYINLCVQLLVLISVLVFAFLFRHYLPSYFSKKGEHLATKQDIEEITTKIERVRTAYAADLERLRSSLEIAVGQTASFTGEQRQAYFRFFESCVELLADKLQVSPGQLPIDGGLSIAAHQKAVEDLFTRVLLDYYRIRLYSEPESDLCAAAQEVVKHSIEASRAFGKNFGPLKLALIREMQSYASEKKSDVTINLKLTDEASRAYRAAVDPHLTEMWKAFESYQGKLNEYLRRQGSALEIDNSADD